MSQKASELLDRNVSGDPAWLVPLLFGVVLLALVKGMVEDHRESWSQRTTFGRAFYFLEYFVLILFAVVGVIGGIGFLVIAGALFIPGLIWEVIVVGYRKRAYKTNKEKSP